MSTTPWVLMTSDPLGCRCMRCGTVWAIGVPIAIRAMLAAVWAFVDQHAACAEPAAGEAQP